MAKMKLDSDMKNRELVENAKTPNDKEKWEIFYKEQKERKLSQIKRRNP